MVKDVRVAKGDDGDFTDYPIVNSLSYCHRKVVMTTTRFAQYSPPNPEIEKPEAKEARGLMTMPRPLRRNWMQKKKRNPQEESEGQEERLPPLANAPKQPEPPKKEHLPGVF